MKRVCCVICLANILVLSLFISIYFSHYNTVSASEIYNNSSKTVVELQSSTLGGIESFGSAIFINEKTLVSNAHLVTYLNGGIYYEYEKYEIRFSFEDYFYEVKLLKYDNLLDVAFLQLINELEFSINPSVINTGEITHGDRVYAIGNAMNHGISITEGIVSIPEVIIEYDGYTKVAIQCDLTINYGNSGGALLDSKGNLIGITTFRTKDNYQITIQTISYSIPINIVLDYYNTII